MGKLSELIEAQFGFKIRAEFPSKSNALVASTPEEILKLNPDRISWDIYNLGTTVAFLSHDQSPSASHGYYLDANGGHIGMDWEKDGELVGERLWAFSTGTPTLFIKAVVGA